MHDQSCQVPSAACQTAKSTGCWLVAVRAPRSGSPAACHQSPTTRGTRIAEALAAASVRTNGRPADETITQRRTWTARFTFIECVQRVQLAKSIFAHTDWTLRGLAQPP